MYATGIIDLVAAAAVKARDEGDVEALYGIARAALADLRRIAEVA